MHNVTTSRHIRTSSELMIMVPIRHEFVPITELVMTYASRISIVLQALAELRQLKVERGFDNPIGPIERLQTIYRVQWTVIEPFEDVTTRSSAVTPQLHGPQVVLTSHFDCSWEDYFHDLITTGGPLLDLIFSHCQDYVGNSCEDGYEAFESFIRRHQRRCDFLYATAPDWTIDDVRYTSRTTAEPNKALSPVAREAGQNILRQGNTTKHDDRTRSALRAIHGLYEMREKLFLDFDPDLEGSGLTSKRRHRSDRKLFEEAVGSTLALEPDVYRLRAALDALHDAPPAPELQKAREWALRIIPRSATVRPPLEHAQYNPPKPQLTPGDVEALLHDVQGNILHGYPAVEQAKLVLVRCHDAKALRALLEWIGGHFTSERDGRAAAAAARVNVGITHHGLELLDLPKTALEAFPREFREGMEERAGLIGDVAHNHPKHWKLPLYPGSASERAHLSTVHVALVVQGNSDQIKQVLTELAAANAQGEVVHELALHPSNQPERSQPLPPALLQAQRDGEASALDVQALGEFIIGYENKDGAVAASTQGAWAELFKNGSFMAMRKMQKNDEAFGEYVEQLVAQIVRLDEPTADELTALRDDVTALIIGRRPDGRMLGKLQPADGRAQNSFDFTSDPKGGLCPLHSHVRRSNPRQHDTPRIARRGLAYRPEAIGPEAAEQGLLFMAVCASLANQYEIVQRWVNGGNSTGLLSRQNDLLCGAPLDLSPRVVSLAGTSAAALPNAPSTLTIPPPPAAFVTLRWGMYLFLPSRQGLAWLSKPQPERSKTLDPDAIKRGNARIAQLEQLPAALRTHEWKRLLEEVPAADSPAALHARDVAAAITSAGGAYRFQGEFAQEGKPRHVEVVVVTKADVAHEVLSNSDQFSVKEYRTRMNKSLRDHYLGYDVSSVDKETGVTYAQFATAANAAMTGLSQRAEEDKEAYLIALKLLKNPESLQLDPDGTGLDSTARNTIAVKDLASAVIGELCHLWLDMPGKDRATKPAAEVDNTRGWMGAVERLLIASRYCFQAMPVDALVKAAQANFNGINADYEAVGPFQSPVITNPSAQFRAPSTYGPVAGTASPSLSNVALKRLRTTLLLGAVGFAPPAIGAVTRILDYWIESEQLWQIQRKWHKDSRILDSAIIDALGKVPAPPTLYRTATAEAPALGALSGHVSEDALVIVNLSAVYDDAVRTFEVGDPPPQTWFFGGINSGAVGGAPQHGCPGQSAGLTAMRQIITAVLEQKNLRRERRLLLSYDRE
jgi:deferrochelatase/peroxidase EfeB